MNRSQNSVRVLPRAATARVSSHVAPGRVPVRLAEAVTWAENTEPPKELPTCMKQNRFAACVVYVEAEDVWPRVVARVAP
jgi:hypothetical protein